MTDELSDEQLKIIERVEKLLRLASKNPNEAEAASATAKAQELLAAYNLDYAMVGEVSAADARREETRLKGGAYRYQRWLWYNVARLNFCVHWCSQRWVMYKVNRKDWDGQRRMVDWKRLQWHHFIVGRVVNVRLSKTMSEYLEQTVERLLRDRLRDQVTGKVPHNQLFSRWAVSYRTGAMNRIVEKIEERRDALLAEEHRKKAEAERAGFGASNALTLTGFVKTEHDANMDFINGEGWSARRAEKRARQAAAERAAAEEYTRWAAANPEEARREEAERRKQQEQQERRAARRARGGRRSSDNMDIGAYYAGYDAAENVSIDQQVDGKREVRSLT